MVYAMILKRKRFAPMRVRESDRIRSAAHLQHIRGFECAVKTSECKGRIEAAHVRNGTDGGTGIKPSDCWAIPLCSSHHYWQHRIGERAFSQLYTIDMKKTAAELWRTSPARRKLEQAQ